MLFMPTTNEILRDIANRRGQSLAYEKDKPLVEDIAKLMASHIELELSHLKKRNEIKRQLLQTKDFSKQKAFNQISANKDKITVSDIVQFLEEFGKYTAKKEDIEAILRRCDHEGDQMINYSEFVEFTSLNEEDLNVDNAETKAYESSPSRKQLKDDIKSSPLRKSNSKSDIHRKTMDEALEDYVDPAEKARQEEELRQQQEEELRQQQEEEQQRAEVARALEYENAAAEEDSKNRDHTRNNTSLNQSIARESKPHEWRFLNLLKNQIKLDKEVEIQKENLFSNLKFNTIDAFKLFDKDGNNFITIEEFQTVIDRMSIAASADKILLKIMRYDKDNDNRIDYQEFLRIITPKND